MNVFYFLIVCFFLGCSDNSNHIVEERTNLTFETLIHNSNTFSNQELATITLRNKVEEIEFLAKYPMSTAFPEIDYRRDMVIGILLGWRSSVSIRVTIDRVRLEGRALKIYAHEFHPIGQRQAIGYPAHLIVLRKSPLPVSFTPIKVIKEDQDSDIHGKWLFKYFEDVVTGKIDIPPSIVRDVTIEFRKPNGIGGQGPCNQYGGSFTLYHSNGLKLESLYSTEMWCGDIIGKWEARYFSALLDVNSYYTNANELKLFFDNKRKAIIYNRYRFPQLPMGAIEGTVKYFVDSSVWIGGETEPSGYILDNPKWIQGEPSYYFRRVYVTELQYQSESIHW